MAYFILNILVLIGLSCFHNLCLKNQKESIILDLSPILSVCAFQSIIVIILFIFDQLDLHFHVLDRAYIFSVYYCFFVLFRFACNFESQKKHKVVNYIVYCGAILCLHYSFFYIDIDVASNVSANILNTGNTFLHLINLKQYSYTPYAIVVPACSISILIIRSFLVSNTVLRYKCAAIVCVYISVFFFYAILVFGGISKQPLNYLFSFVTLYLLLVLYRVYLINHVISLKKGIKAIKKFGIEYMAFALVVAIVFTMFYLLLSVNLGLFGAIGALLIFLLFYAQAIARKKNKDTFIRDIADVALGNYFKQIDYMVEKETLIQSFQNMLQNVFDATNTEFYVLEGEELHAVYSSRNFLDSKINVQNDFFLKLYEKQITVITPDIIWENDELQKDADTLFKYCDSHAIILMHGDRNIIAMISFAEKARSIDYSSHDIYLMKYFYSNFFVFGYYLQTTMKESLMNVIAREIEYSGQVTASIYKNIDAIQHKTIDSGYLSKSLRNVGGDFIDLIRLTENRHMFVVGDVSGRGLNASMCMIILKSFIRTFLAESSDFSELIHTLNAFIKHNLPRGTFFAGTFMIFDKTDNMVYYINCGVPGIFLYSKSYNNVIEIQGEGKVLGFIDNIKDLISIKKIQLNAGDVILTCSDGITESLSLRGEEYGKRRIENLLLENRLFPAQNICTFLYDDVQAFTAKGITDDVSILILKILE